MNRRLYPRRHITFPATYMVDGRTAFPAYGLDFGGGGLQLLTREPLKPDAHAVELVALIKGRHLRFQAVHCWSDTIPSPQGRRYRHGLRMKHISDSDWDYLMRMAMEEDVQLMPGAVLSAGMRDMLVPLEKQHRIAAALALAHRITYEPGHKLPLIEYAFEGYTMRMGTRYYVLSVRSRVAEHDDVREYRTRVLAAIESEGVRIVE